jgi:poly(A) polymerase/tRNA nucleotidyltransferase (CCA-adding enzyme)
MTSYFPVLNIPAAVLGLIQDLKRAGYEAHIVGGCVRDLLSERVPHDWDLTTNARPEQILGVFPQGKYENDFGTVIVPVKVADENKLALVAEITTYRSEKDYSDRRHPDTVSFETRIDADLSRRDFTINALAADITLAKEDFTKIFDNVEAALELRQITPEQYNIIDLFGGISDLKRGIIRAVGEPDSRFREDALRLLRAIRFSCQLNFVLEPKTERAIVKLAGSLKFVAKERIRDELIKILSSDRPAVGIESLRNLKLLQYIMPEILAGVDLEQNHHHIYTVYKHSLLSLQYCPSTQWPVRLAALLHDIGKPKTHKFIDGQATFYNHEYAGARIAEKIMTRLKFSGADSERVVNLVKNHMFYYNVGEVTAASVRRLVAKTGKENLKDLIDIRVADRLGSGVKVAKPYKLRHLEYMLEKVQNDPISVKMLKINGTDLMQELNIPPSPKLGAILEILLSEVIEDPELNLRKLLLERALKLAIFDLEELRRQAKAVIEDKRQENDKSLKHGFGV